MPTSIGKQLAKAYDDKLMFVRVEFEAGSIGILHSQISHAESGVFEVEIAGEKKY